ncbi:MAG: hypothetical protein Q9170_001621 [Blastenia crenularia]
MVGQKHALAITIRPADPTNVKCGNAPQQYEESKCEPLLDVMPADVLPVRTWGPRRQPGIDLPLPHSWAAEPSLGSTVREYSVAFGVQQNNVSAAPHDRCRLYVLGTNAERPAIDTMSFYDMWQAATMVAGTCARYGKPGVMRGLGARSLLWLAIDDGTKAPHAAATNETLDANLSPGWDKTAVA